ncbi:unnamed protein product, partial [Owenia fusiformis]
LHYQISKMIRTVLLLAIVSLSWVSSAPTLEEGDLFEGDIVLPDGVEDPYSEEDNYNAIRRASALWPGGVVPYTMSATMSSKDRTTFNAAIADYERYTCLRWVPRTTESAYVDIIRAGGCYSSVGRTGRKQSLSLGNGCWNKGIIIHEMMHAIGFWHEQSRLDRDNYITIAYQNIRKGMEHNFKKMTSSQATDILSYDYGSIMHYGERAFSVNRQPTLIAKRKGVAMGQRAGFSALDSQKIGKLYAGVCGSGKGGITSRPTVRPTIRPTPRPGGVCNGASGRRSGSGGRPIRATFINRTNRTVRLHWVNFNGGLSAGWLIGAGRRILINTNTNHPFVARVERGQWLKVGGECAHAPRSSVISITY